MPEVGSEQRIAAGTGTQHDVDGQIALLEGLLEQGVEIQIRGLPLTEQLHATQGHHHIVGVEVRPAAAHGGDDAPPVCVAPVQGRLYQLLPRQIYSGEQGPFHVQGIAVDLDRGYMYFSFTTTLLKTDMQGNLLGSVEGMTGHLGCMTLNPDDGRLYASIEYKHDAIGKGILNKLEGVRNDEQTGFYVAVFDVDRIDRIGMNAEKDDVMKTVYIKEAVDDYYAKVSNNGQELEHRFGCSGIDGVTFAPAFGQSRDGKKYLYVAYGIYGDTLRTDNDYQVILAYDTRDWKQYEQPLTQENLHKSGPEKPLHKYFLYTGNTSWGIQNLAYDKASGNMHAAVYKGKKSHYPNYSYFVIDGSKAPERKQLQGFDPAVEAEVLSLLPEGLHDAQSDTWGWNFKWGTTGLCPIGDGYFYISHNAKDKQTGNQSSTVQLYKWTGNPDKAFELVE